ncbi:MAG TPA: ATP-dependent DNA ligase, partial [Gemmatimonadaceae bacterium]|nr:ATP-dependent DNA ligase [Gemmatimonadaceae bacterium]
MTLPIKLPFLPMEAVSVATIPEGDNWQYEPKWDGFRCVVFRDGDEVHLQSKAGQPLERYFPDLVEQVLALGAKRFVVDGEIVVPVDGDLSFDDLLMRIHPAASRIARLAAETPAILIVFDFLVTERGTLLTNETLATRRQKLEDFAERYFKTSSRMKLSPATTKIGVVNKWFENVGGGLDGIIAKELDKPYCAGERKGMVKVKQLRTVDCVVGGFRYASKGKLVGSLLLGLYDDDGLLHHVGFWSSIRNEDRKALTAKVEKLIRKPGFTGKAPG